MDIAKQSLAATVSLHAYKLHSQYIAWLVVWRLGRIIVETKSQGNIQMAIITPQMQ